MTTMWEWILIKTAQYSGAAMALAITFIILPTKRVSDIALRIFLILVLGRQGEKLILQYFGWGDDLAMLAQGLAALVVWMSIGFLRFLIKRDQVLADTERLVRAWRGRGK